MFITKKPLLLASGSPRRQQYFQELGLDFTICIADIDEHLRLGEVPRDFVMRMASEKAQSVMKKHPRSWVVAADTIVSMGERIMGKPKDSEDALAMLMELSGKEHLVMTGICLGNSSMEMKTLDTTVSKVEFTHFSKEIARSYISTGESLDKAGAYGIQGKGAFLVRSLIGSYSNVVGLPLAEIVRLLIEYNIIVPRN